MFDLIFYRDKNNKSELLDFLEKLRQKEEKGDKNSRIQMNQITMCMELLSTHGTRLSEEYTKHIEDGIWELRPGDNRVLYFFFENNTYVLLHLFRKKTQKTPRREINKAKSERTDFLNRHKGVENNERTK